MKTRNRITCQGTNDRFTWMQWLASQIQQADCSRPLLVSIEYADTDDPGWEPMSKREPSLLQDLVIEAYFEVQADGRCGFGSWSESHAKDALVAIMKGASDA